MKLIRKDSKETVNLGDSLYYEGLSDERYTFVGIKDNHYILASRFGKTTLFNPYIFKCELINDSSN